MQKAFLSQANSMAALRESVRICLRKYADFSGRATRAEFWWWLLAIFLAGIAVTALDMTINSLLSGVSEYAFSPLSPLFVLAVLLPHLAATTRRLHDVGKSGWWQLVWLLIFGGAWTIFLVVVAASLGNYIIGEGYNVGPAEFRSALTFDRFGPAIFGVLFAMAVTVAALIWCLTWLTRQGEGPNRHGPDPRATE